MILITLVIACGYGLLVAALNTFDLGSVLTVQSLGLSEARAVLLIITLSTLLGFYMEPFNGVISATMGQALPSVLLAVSKAVELIGAACALIVFSAGPVTVAAVMLGATLLNLAMNVVVAIFYAPWISFSFRDFDLGALRRTWKASLGFFALLVCVVVFASQLPRLIIFHYFGASVLAGFSVLVIYTRAARLLAQTMSQGAQVEIGRAFAHGLLSQVKHIIEAILGGAVGTAGLILAAEIVLAPVVIPIWTHGQVQFSWDVLVVLALVAFVGAYFDAAMVGVAAINRVGSTALAYGAGLAVGLLGGTALLPILGPVREFCLVRLLLPEFSGAWAAIRRLNNTVPELRLAGASTIAVALDPHQLRRLKTTGDPRPSRSGSRWLHMACCWIRAWQSVPPLMIIGQASFGWRRAAPTTQIPWNSIRQVAEQFVAKESPADIWPFRAADTRTLAAATKKGICRRHFDPIQLSADN